MKEYYRQRQKFLGIDNKYNRRNTFTIILVLIVSLLAIVYSGYNAIETRAKSEEETLKSVNEVAKQVVNTIDTDIDDKKTLIAGFANSLQILYEDNYTLTSQDSYIENFLSNKIIYSDFNYIIFQREGLENIIVGDVQQDVFEKFNENSDSYSALDSINKAITINDTTAYIEEGHVVYASPVYVNGQLIGAICAGIDDEIVSNLALTNYYQEVREFCIINTEGMILLSSNEQLFIDLEQSYRLVYNDANSTIKQQIFSGQTGVQEVQLDGEKYYLNYTSLKNANWIMVTLIPNKAITDSFNVYMNRALICGITLALFFMIIFMMFSKRQIRSQKKLEEFAFSDDLTGGININDFKLRYGQIQRNKACIGYSIVMLDVIDFGLINETLGFSIGDEVLKHIYWCIDEKLSQKENEFVARGESDHFFICLHEVDIDKIRERIKEIVTNINTEKFKKYYEFTIQFKQGACVIDDVYTSIDVYLERSRIATKNQDYSSLNKVVLFQKSMEQKLNDARNMEVMASNAIENGEFVPYFQPKVSISKHQVVGCEALVRWISPTKGLIPPNEFIPILESSGRITQLDYVLFEQVCIWLKKRYDDGLDLFPVSVNLSRAHFWKDDFLKDYIALVDKYEIEHKYIEFEITETVFMEDNKLNRIKDGIITMHKNGFKCAVDDFGVGYSSLSFVSDNDADIIKMDRSFFLNLQDEKAQKVVKCLINMAHELDLEIVIEGIEQQEQIDFLASVGADVVQGYYYSKPLSADDFAKWLLDFKQSNNNDK